MPGSTKKLSLYKLDFNVIYTLNLQIKTLNFFLKCYSTYECIISNIYLFIYLFVCFKTKLYNL